MRKTRKAIVDLMKREAEWLLSRLLLEESKEGRLFISAQYLSIINMLLTAHEITHDQYQEYLTRYTNS